MFVVVVLFILSGLLFYPITLMAKAEDGALRLYWLPHLFASEAQPVEIKIHKRQEKEKREKALAPKTALIAEYTRGYPFREAVVPLAIV